MKRRELLQAGLKLGLFAVGSSLVPLRGFADMLSGERPQFCIYIRVGAGWDTSLATDPWKLEARPEEKDFFIEYRQDELISFQNSLVGPAMAPLKKFFDRLCIINGVYMSATDGGHDSAALYAASGNGQGGLGLIPLELEGRLFSSPFGTLANHSPYMGSQAKGVWDLRNIVQAKQIADVTMLLDNDDKETEISRARKAILNNSSRIDLFNKVAAKSSSFTEAEAISAAFCSGLTHSACLELNESNLDTHSAHPRTHLAALTSVFAKINSLLESLHSTPGVDARGAVLETSTLLDQTTLLIGSEFTRTPALNGSSGKDHNPQCNSAILIGPGVKAGVVGASTLVTRAQSKAGMSYLSGLPLDSESLEPVRRREGSFILRPESVMSTLIKSMGGNPAVISRGLGAAPVLKNALR